MKSENFSQCERNSAHNVGNKSKRRRLLSSCNKLFVVYFEFLVAKKKQLHLHSSQHCEHMCWIYWVKRSLFFVYKEEYVTFDICCFLCLSLSLFIGWLDGWNDKGASLVSQRLWVQMSSWTFDLFYRNNFCLPIFCWLLWKICLDIRISHK